MEKERAELACLVKKHDRIQSVMRFVNIRTLKKAYEKVSKVYDRVAAEYGKDLTYNLNALLSRMKKFAYYPQSGYRQSAPDNSDKRLMYEFRCFEDQMVLYVFKEILKAIYMGKETQRIIEQQGSEMSIILGSNTLVKIEGKGILEGINQEQLIQFLERDIADRNFIRYIKRFLNNGILECGNRRKNERMFSSVLGQVYLYYTLQIFLALNGIELKGWMKVRGEKEKFCYIFRNVIDARVVCRLLKRELHIMIPKSDICVELLVRNPPIYCSDRRRRNICDKILARNCKRRKLILCGREDATASKV